MPRIHTPALVSIGAFVLLVFAAVAAVFTDLGRHPRIASALLAALVAVLLGALFLPGKRGRR